MIKNNKISIKFEDNTNNRVVVFSETTASETLESHIDILRSYLAAVGYNSESISEYFGEH